MNKLSFGIKGRVIVSVIRDGKVVRGPVETKNLWLDQGLNNMSTHPICELFEVAAKGIGTDPTTEDLTATANTYSIPNGSTTITRTAGTRNFTSDDISKLILFTNGKQFRISGITSTTVASVSAPASPAITNLKMTLYSVQFLSVTEKGSRADEYSSVAGENSTTTASNVRTFRRAFIFPVEDTMTEKVGGGTFSQAGTTVSRVSGTNRDFTVDDIGKTLTFVANGNTGIITAIIDVDSFTLDVSQTVPEDKIVLTLTDSQIETVSGSYSRAGSVVTRTSGARNFTAGDIGSTIHFTNDNVEAEITAFTDATHVTVDVAGTIAAQDIVIYGHTDYTEIGFSHSDESGPNVNIRVLLASAVRAAISTPFRASDQLKVTYECVLTVEPHTSTAANLNSIINDPANQMSGNKNGDYVIETFATSTVATDGTTNLSLTDLEPYYDGFAGWSLDSTALVPLVGTIRQNSLATVPMVGEANFDFTFSRIFTGLFGLNDAVNNNWRSLMIVDPESKLAIFTFLFDVVQHKDGEHTFTIVFRKTWDRDFT